MYDIEMHAPSEEFLRCWAAAGRHLHAAGQGAMAWLKAEPRPPFLEHLSFRLGNQLFFVRIEDVEGRLRLPGNPDGALTIARGCQGHACVLPMRQRSGVWSPSMPGWGLVDAETGDRINPPRLVTDELIEITDWELHDLAVQVVRNHLESLGASVMSSTGDPHIHPSLWAVREGRREWVVVRAVRYPTLDAPQPGNMAAIIEHCARGSRYGYFASVGVAHADEEHAPEGADPIPLWRGHGYSLRFEGLVSVSE